MMSKYSILLPFSLLLYCCLKMQMASSASSGTALASYSRELFAADIFGVLTNERTTENVIYSPASIQTCLALAYLGAEGKTAKEMQIGLRLYNDDKSATARNYADFLRANFGNQTGAELKMANAIFVNENNQIASKFAQLAKQFQSVVTTLKFANAAESVNHINNWVEQATNSKIKNLLEEKTITQDTSSVFVNAIYFKGLWKHPFSLSQTSKAEFKTITKQYREVDMMNRIAEFGYAELSQFDAKAVELPYKDSNLNMLIILPNEEHGLEELEQKLQGVDLNVILLSTAIVEVFLPRFKIEFAVDLKEPIRKLGMPTMFEEEADFSSMFIAARQTKVDKIGHKAYLEVNEAGSEAAAATFLTTIDRMLPKTFRADHPFVFAIRNKQAVYFAGHVVNL